MKETMNELEIRDLVRNEIQACFHEISENVKNQGDDIKQIKDALLGSEFNRAPLVDRIQRNEDYIEYSIANKIIQRAEPALERFEIWEKNGMWKSIEEALELVGNWKWAYGLLIGGGIGGIIATITGIVQFVRFLIQLM